MKHKESAELHRECQAAFAGEIGRTIKAVLSNEPSLTQAQQQALLPSLLFAVSAQLSGSSFAGELGAVNIYRAQIFVARLTAPSLVPVLNEFLSHERRHLKIFTQVLAGRGIARCKSYWFCGLGGWVLGFLTALFGKAGIMACTAAVETVVTGHLVEQLQFLRQAGDTEVYSAVASIVEEELEHKDHGVAQGKGSVLYRPLGVVVAASTSFVIWLGTVL